MTRAASHPVSDPAGGLRASDALFLLQVGVGAQTALSACAT